MKASEIGENCNVCPIHLECLRYMSNPNTMPDAPCTKWDDDDDITEYTEIK